MHLLLLSNLAGMMIAFVSSEHGFLFLTKSVSCHFYLSWEAYFFPIEFNGMLSVDNGAAVHSGR